MNRLLPNNLHTSRRAPARLDAAAPQLTQQDPVGRSVSCCSFGFPYYLLLFSPSLSLSFFLFPFLSVSLLPFSLFFLHVLSSFSLSRVFFLSFFSVFLPFLPSPSLPFLPFRPYFFHGSNKTLGKKTKTTASPFTTYPSLLCSFQPLV